MMRSSLLWLVSLGSLASWLYLGCSAGKDTNDRGTSSSQGAAGGQGPGVGGSGTGGMDACAKFTATAEQQPAAMLIVLDMTASMGTSGKWGAAQLAVVAAIDKDVFDSMSLGLVTFPTSTVTGPDCILNFPVTCGTSALPQVAMAPAGTEKSNASTGVRSQIYNYLVNHSPISSVDDGSPVYDAMAAGYAALSLYSGVDRRILVVITDGGFSCTSLSTRPGYMDLNGCPDWEDPNSVLALISSKANDATTPINTFVVGVPGSNSTGQSVGGFDTPPYNMLLALSTYAVAGSPDTVDPNCDSGAVYMQNGAAPATPCHIDLSNGQMFDASALADAISDIRGNALGCVYELPEPPPGETIDPNQVNVQVTIGSDSFTLPKRSNPSDDCASDGCWDYTPTNEIEILGKTCTDLSSAPSASVEIVVGCQTIVK